MKIDEKKQLHFWNSFASRYDHYTEKFAGALYYALSKQVMTYLKYDDKVIDAACGTGELAIKIAPFVQQVYGVDFSSEMLQMAANKITLAKLANIALHPARVQELPFQDNFADVLLAVNIVHLLPDVENALSEWKRILRPGGLLILPTLCHAEHWRSRLLSRLLLLSRFRIARRWSSNALQQTVLSLDFELVESKLLPGNVPLLFLVVRKK